jgi:hypothetical protein
LQIATEFATIGSMSSASQPIRLNAEDKLAALRRLDGKRYIVQSDQLLSAFLELEATLVRG